MHGRDQDTGGIAWEEAFRASRDPESRDQESGHDAVATGVRTAPWEALLTIAA